MITEAIVLAGGLGTRLQSVVWELPKSLAPVARQALSRLSAGLCKKTGNRKIHFCTGI